MSHHSNQEFPRVLLEEMDRILLQIRQINDQAEALISRARDIAALAKRTVSENIKVHLESLKAEDRIRQADQVIEREAQREVERREQSIDDGRIVHAEHPSRGPDMTFGSIHIVPVDQSLFGQPILRGDLSGEGDAARDIVRNIAEPGFDMIEEERANDIARGLDQPLIGKTLEEAAVEFVRGTIAAQTQNEESPAAPPVEQEMDTGAAEAVSPQPVEAAPVDEQDSSAVESAPEAAAEEAKVIPPEDSSAVDTPMMRALNESYQAFPEEFVAVDPAERQHANAKEANEFSDKVLDLWNSTLLTEAQIAKRLATGKPLIMMVLEQARTDQDPRVMGKRGVVPKPPKEHMPLSAIARKIMERPVPTAAARAGVELGDFLTGMDTMAENISTGVCVVDLGRNVIIGKKGKWTTDKARAQTVAYINNGQMYPKLVLSQRCGWRDEREFTDAITPMMERLRDIGIIMTSLPTGIVIRVAD